MRSSAFRQLCTPAGPYRIFAETSVQTSSHPPAIVFVHGLVASHRYMMPVARCLAAHHPVYVPDLPGYGRSSRPSVVLDVHQFADALVAWLSALDLGSVCLLANSFGCQVAADAAVRYPDAVSSLVLVGPVVDPSGATWFQQVGRLLLDGPRERRSLWPVLALDFLQMGARRALGTFDFMLRFRIQQYLPDIRQPTLVVRGADDPVVSQAWADEVSRLLPDGHLAVVSGTGHAVNYSAPDRLSDLVQSFLSATGP